VNLLSESRGTMCYGVFVGDGVVFHIVENKMRKSLTVKKVKVP